MQRLSSLIIKFLMTSIKFLMTSSGSFYCVKPQAKNAEFLTGMFLFQEEKIKKTEFF